jgi:hypothetical protein
MITHFLLAKKEMLQATNKNPVLYAQRYTWKVKLVAVIKENFACADA